MTGAMPRLYILIVSWNTRELLDGCLASIYTHPPQVCYEVWVVDNASNDGSPAMVKENFPQVHLITNQVNHGFAAANNQAARLINGNYLLLLNPDTIIHRDCLENLCAHLDGHPQTGIVGPRILNPDGSLQVSAHPAPSLFREAWRLFHLDRLASISEYPQSVFNDISSRPVDVLKGACMMIRREAIGENGLFDERFFMYSEEVDLCTRVSKAGWRIDWLPSATITHFGGQSTRQKADDMFLELYRNKVKYFRKHFGRVRTGLYKCILLFAALVRWFPGRLMSRTNVGREHGWDTIARQYGRLLSELPRF